MDRSLRKVIQSKSNDKKEDDRFDDSKDDLSIARELYTLDDDE